MYPAAFEYHAPTSVKDALKLLGKLKDSKLLAGGHSLIPMMKLRLAQPKHLIDLGKVKGLGGVKGAGETGTIAATPAVVNAVVDALAPLGIDHIETMPLTAARVWSVMKSAKR